MMHGGQPPRRMRYSVESRLRVVTLIEGGMAPAVAARASGASRASAYRWWRRYRDAGWEGVCDRSSVPHRSRAGRLVSVAAPRFGLYAFFERPHDE
jgi:transposase-like protein